MSLQRTASPSSNRTINRILFLSLPAVIQAGDDYLQDGHSFHLGLAYLAGVMRQNAYTVNILDCFAEDRQNVRSSDADGWLEVGRSNEQIMEHIHAYAPDLIGVSIPFSCQHYEAQAILGLIKRTFPHIVIVVGGNHVTALSHKIDATFIDYFVVGEGEYAFLQLVEALNQHAPTDIIPGVKAQAAAYVQPKHIERLDDLPFPAIDLLPLTKLWASGRRWINMVATRGCVYDCNFCSIHTIMGYKIRRRSVENVIAELRHWKQLYNIQEVYFEDDNLTTNKRWAKELFRQIAANHFGIRFYARNGIRADSIDKELLTLMKAAGFQDFMIAPESGNQRTLDEIIGKKMRLEDCTQAVQLAAEVGIGVNAFFVLGFPGETLADLETTLRYAQSLKDLGCAGFWLSLATPYPGTRFYERCIEQGLLPEDMDYRKFRTVDYLLVNPNFTAAELKAFRQRAMAELAPLRRSLAQKAVRSLNLLTKDPAFFFSKLRYKLGAYF